VVDAGVAVVQRLAPGCYIVYTFLVVLDRLVEVKFIIVSEFTVLMEWSAGESWGCVPG